MRSETTAHRSPLLTVVWSRTDGMRFVTIIGGIGLVAAVAMAVFGLPQVDVHGPLHRLGIMDPLCSGTRAARLTARGNLVQAWRYNPLGIAATLAAAFAIARAAVGVVGRRWFTLRFAWTPKRIRIAVAVLLVGTVLLEIRQQGRADLLLKPY